jgi:hypothetical protein
MRQRCLSAVCVFAFWPERLIFICKYMCGVARRDYFIDRRRNAFDDARLKFQAHIILRWMRKYFLCLDRIWTLYPPLVLVLIVFSLRGQRVANLNNRIIFKTMCNNNFFNLRLNMLKNFTNLYIKKFMERGLYFVISEGYKETLWDYSISVERLG